MPKGAKPMDEGGAKGVFAWLLGGLLGLTIAIGLALYCIGRAYGSGPLEAGGLATLCAGLGFAIAALLGFAAKLLIDQP